MLKSPITEFYFLQEQEYPLWSRLSNFFRLIIIVINARCLFQAGQFLIFLCFNFFVNSKDEISSDLIVFAHAICVLAEVSDFDVAKLIADSTEVLVDGFEVSLIIHVCLRDKLSILIKMTF